MRRRRFQIRIAPHALAARALAAAVLLFHYASPALTVEGEPDSTPDLARWTWIGVVESGSDPMDPSIVPGAPLKIEFVADRAARRRGTGQILGFGDCDVEANLRLWVGDSVFELGANRQTGDCPYLDLSLSLDDQGGTAARNPAVECIGRLDAPECAVLSLFAAGEAWCTSGAHGSTCSRVALPHGPEGEGRRYWEVARLGVRFADDAARFPNLWAAASPDSECQWSFGQHFIIGDGLLPPDTPDLSALPPGEIVLELPFRDVRIRGRLIAPGGVPLRTAWTMGGSVVDVHDGSGGLPFDPALSFLPLGSRVQLDISVDDARPTSRDPCGVTSAGRPPPDVHTRLDFGLAPDRDFRISGRLGDYRLAGRDWESCDLLCERPPRLDVYAATATDPLVGWLPSRLQQEEAYFRSLGCEEDRDEYPPECAEPWVDPANPPPLDTLILTTSLHRRAVRADGATSSALVSVLLQGSAVFDPDRPLANSFDFSALRTARVLAVVLAEQPSHFVEIELDHLEKHEWRCRPPFFPGDATGDGAVDLDDEQRIRGNLGKRYVSQRQGDLDCDGFVDEADLAIWADNLRPPLFAPEPSFGAALLIGAASLVASTGRSRSSSVRASSIG
ncbi:MAG: hypothetical protein NXI30_07710 [bacterium]|nr:hypothetical protein [bacterium]